MSSALFGVRYLVRNSVGQFFKGTGFYWYGFNIQHARFDVDVDGLLCLQGPLLQFRLAASPTHVAGRSGTGVRLDWDNNDENHENHDNHNFT